jgi:hypothetical protein
VISHELRAGPGFSPSAGDRVISDEEDAHAGLLLTSSGPLFEQARIEFQCSKVFALSSPTNHSKARVAFPTQSDWAWIITESRCGESRTGRANICFQATWAEVPTVCLWAEIGPLLVTVSGPVAVFRVGRKQPFKRLRKEDVQRSKSAAAEGSSLDRAGMRGDPKPAYSGAALIVRKFAIERPNAATNPPAGTASEALLLDGRVHWHVRPHRRELFFAIDELPIC